MEDWEKEFDKKFTYGNKWKTYDFDGSPKLVEPEKIKKFIRNLLKKRV